MAKCPQFVLIYIDFGPRATLKGPKRSFLVLFVVVLVVVSVESSSKNDPNRTKMCMETITLRSLINVQSVITYLFTQMYLNEDGFSSAPP